MSDLNNNTHSNFSKQLTASFILQDKYVEQLRTSSEISVYAYLERITYRNIPLTNDGVSEFCSSVGISHEEIEPIFDRLAEIGFLTKGN